MNEENYNIYRRLRIFWRLKKFSIRHGHWAQRDLAEKHIDMLKKDHPMLNFLARIFS